MPRKHRMYLPGVPAHVVQRGNNRAASFFHEDDYRFYLAALADALKRYRVELHAYVLMTNHVHLLMTLADTEGISRVMQHVGRLYVLYINRTYRRTGTLWEGRHKASLVNAAENLLTCYRYIELTPPASRHGCGSGGISLVKLWLACLGNAEWGGGGSSSLLAVGRRCLSAATGLSTVVHGAPPGFSLACHA